MQSAREPRPSLLPDAERADFSEQHLRWLVQLRWVAMLGVAVAAAAAYVGLFPGVAWLLLLTVALAGTGYNIVLHFSFRGDRSPPIWRSAYFQGFVDFALLTIVLWAAGGVSCPFLGYYVFHVALFGILGGPRALLIATVESLFLAGLLAVTHFVPELQIGVWAPVPPWDYAGDVVAFLTTLGAASYLVYYAVEQLRDREHALADARDRAALEYELLSRSLNELDAGLEVIDDAGEIVWRNRPAEQLVPWSQVGDRWECPRVHRGCEQDATGNCPVATAREAQESGRCRFAATMNGHERVYEMLVFPLSMNRHGRRGAMTLYVDRTHATLAERQLTIAERLASLGRIAQGVAHELNTPLATIRTLATDMRAALKELQPDSAPAILDLDESATLIQDETRRLGKITHALLSGRDLSGSHIRGSVPLSAAVERAAALVFAGSRNIDRLHVDDAIDGVHVSADADRVVQILVNLLQNANDAVRMKAGAKIRVSAESSSDAISIVIDDDGPGIPDAIQPRLFEPFATSKPPGEGTGLGLYTSYMLADSMKGRIELSARPEGGTRAVVELPRVVCEEPG